MVKSIYVTEDKKSGFNSSLMLYDNDALAIRDFANAVKNPGTLLHTNPEDFNLWRIGTYDTNDNTIEPMATPVVVAKAVEFKKVEVD